MKVKLDVVWRVIDRDLPFLITGPETLIEDYFEDSGT